MKLIKELVQLQREGGLEVNFANKRRYKNSTIPSMQRMLNNNEMLKKKRLRKFGCLFIFVPANYVQFISVSLSL